MIGAFLLGLLAVAAAAAADDCRLQQAPDQTVAVIRVTDGDTVRLGDGRVVRLIGINAPELSHDGSTAQPHAEQAAARLAELLQGRGGVGVVWEGEHRDRYQRALAHLYLPDGQNVQELMVREGQAIAIAVPPNIAQFACYARAEQQARRHRLGLWRLAYYQPLSGAQRDPGVAGFRLIRGRVRSIGDSAKSVWLNLEGDLALRVARNDLQYFSSLDLHRLLGKEVEAKGWLRPYRGQLVMQLRHPGMLEVIAP
ncbi:MAG: thermonuclease family protein [Gammaproteobacteria bacterium]|nr:thermonuclease family protein [Gammaproteobacteria bacterium]